MVAIATSSLGIWPKFDDRVGQVGPRRGLDGREDGDDQEDDRQPDLEELGLLERLVDDGRRGQRDADRDQQDDRDDVGVAADEVGEDRGPRDAPARPHVGHDREDAEEDAPGLPEAREAGHRGLAGGQRVALDLHVEEVLDGDAEDGRPQEAQADVGGDVGPEDVLARAHAQAREDDARPEDLAERQRLRHVRVLHRRQMVARWLGGVMPLSVGGSRRTIRRRVPSPCPPLLPVGGRPIRPVLPCSPARPLGKREATLTARGARTAAPDVAPGRGSRRSRPGTPRRPGSAATDPAREPPTAAASATFLKATAKGASVLSSGGAIRVATADPTADRATSATTTTPSVSPVTSIGVQALEEAPAEAEADDDHGAVDQAAADPLGDAGDLGVQHPGEHGGRHEARAERERDRAQPDQLAGREVDERGREHQGEAVGDQHEDEQVPSGHLGDVGVGRDERRGRRGGDQEEAEAERLVEPDGEPDERQGKRGEREVQAEQDQPGAQPRPRARAAAAPRP